MKISIIGNGCVREETIVSKLISKMIDEKLERATSLEESDYLVYITCAGVGDTIKKILDQLYKIAMIINSDYTNSKLIVTGCLTNVFDLQEYLERYLTKDKFKIITNKDFVIPTINYILDDNKRNTKYTRLDNRTNLIHGSPAVAQFFISDGCSNRCSFCKTNYNHSKVVSVPLEQIITHIKKLVSNGLKKLIISSENSCLYGIDLYNKRMLHILLKRISEIDGLDKIFLNEVTIRNMYPELLDEIVSNPKIKCVDLQLESASNRILGLMNRGHTIEEYDDVACRILDSGKYINTILMSGFPTEDESDLETTIEYVRKRKILVGDVCEYSDFYLIPSHKLPQYTAKEKKSHTDYLKKNTKINNLDIYRSLDLHDFILVKHGNGFNIFTCDIPLTVISYGSKYDNTPIGSHVDANIKRLVKKNKYNQEVGYVI